MPISTFNWAGESCELHRKTMKNIRLRLMAPHGAIRVSAPTKVAFAKILNFLETHKEWIVKQRARMAAQPPISSTQTMRDEHHLMLLGNKLLINRSHASNCVIKIEAEVLNLYTPEHYSLEQQEAVLEGWLRQYLMQQVEPLAHSWAKTMNLDFNELRLKRMKTRWGTCNPRAKRIWINTQLIHLPLACLEYVIVHELVHLLEASHNRRFYELMSQTLPNWKTAHLYLKSIKI